MSTASELSTTQFGKVENIIVDSLIIPRERLRIANKIDFPYYLNDDHITTLSKLFDRYIDSDGDRESSHPIATCLLYYAAKRAYEEMKKINKPFIDIGASITQRGANHRCIQLDNDRDQYRYAMSSSLLPEKGIRDMVENVIDNKIRKRVIANYGQKICTGGSQCCDFQAEYAVSVHSMYDMTFEQIVQMFEKHNIRLLVSWMYLPLELLDNDVVKTQNCKKIYIYTERDGNSCMSFPNDMSFLYVHNKENWKRFLTHTVIRAQNFNIVMEINRSYGPMHKIYFRRVAPSKINNCYRMLPIGQELKEYIKVPNMRYIIAKNFKENYENVPLLVVRRDVVVNLYKFICRGPDGSFNYERGATYFNGLSSRIVIGSTIVHNELNVEPVEYDDILFSVMILAAASRLRRTKNYSVIIKKMSDFKNYFGRKTDFYKEFKESVGDKIQSFFDLFIKRKMINFDFNEPNSRDFLMFTFDVFTDDMVSNTYDARNFKRDEPDCIKSKSAQYMYFEPDVIDKVTTEIEKEIAEESEVDDEINESSETILSCDQPDIIKEQSDILNTNKSILCKNDQLYKSIVRTEKVSENRAYCKLKEIISKYKLERKYSKIVEIGIAPGHFSRILKDYTKQLVGYHYTGKDMIELKINNYTRINKFNEHLHIEDQIDMLISDVGDEEHTKACLLVLEHIKRIKHGGNLIFKCWIDMLDDDIYNLLTDFSTIEVFKPNSSFSVNSEVYVVCLKYMEPSKFGDQFYQTLFSTYNYINGMYKMYFEGGEIRPVEYKETEIEFVKHRLKLTYNQCYKYVKEFVETADSDFKVLHDEILNKIKSLEPKDIEVECYIHNAVAGSGKSNDIIAKATKNDLVIVPTRKLKQSYMSRGVKVVKTFHAALKMKGKFKNIFIDEIYLLPRSYLYFLKRFIDFKTIYCYGDSGQIPLVDFNGCNYMKSDMMPTQSHNNVVSNRFTADVCNALSTHYKCYTTNKRKRGIFKLTKLKEYIDICKGGINFMVATQDHKERMTAYCQDLVERKNYRDCVVNTIHEYEGTTVDNVVWLIEEKDEPLLSRNEYVTVAFTRHRNSLIIYGEGNIKYSELNFYNSNIEDLAAQSLIPVVDNVYYSTPEMTIKHNEDPVFHTIKPVSVYDVLPTLEKISFLYGQGTYVSDARFMTLPGIQQGKANMNYDALAKTDYPVNGRCMIPFNTCRIYDSKDPLNSIKTLFGRYGLVTRLMSEPEVRSNVKILEDGLSKFLIHPVGSKEYKEIMAFDIEDVSMHFKDYIEALSKKNLSEKDLDKSFCQVMQTNGLKAISYFMKKQTKFDATENFMIREKYGQGVNAWDKMMNVIFSCFARSYSCKIKKLMKPNVIYANGEPDVNFGVKASACISNYMESHNGRYPVSVENDFTEYDTSQNEATIEWEMNVLRDLGVTEQCVQLYGEHKKRWKTSYPGKCSLSGVMKKHSGEPFTLDFNTTLNMSICGAIYEIEDLNCALFKGDDSCVYAHEVRFTETGEDLLKRLGFKAKMHRVEVSEFTGYIVSKDGFYPDLIRRLSKVLSKVYKNEEEFAEMKLAVYDIVRVISNNKLNNCGPAMLCSYYNKIIKDRGTVNKSEFITEPEIRNIVSFLFNFQRISWDDLCYIYKEPITLSAPSKVSDKYMKLRKI